MDTSDEPDFERNRRAWDAESDAYQARHRAQLSATPKAWGVWSLPESEIGLLGDVAGRDVLEYGCGGAAWSIALARDGARVTGLDNSVRQLEHARDAIVVAGVDVRLVHAPGERTPFPDDSFDIVFCDHGAMSFAAPEATIPEVARILRVGGALAFCVEHPLHAACWHHERDAPVTSLQHSYFDLGRIVDRDDQSVNYNRPVATYLTLLIDAGFTIERILEPRPAPEGQTTYDRFAPLEWARDYPIELLVRATLGRRRTS